MMRLRGQSGGYTIVETLIFLAVTSAIFITAMFFLGGQTAKNEFNTGIRDAQSRIADILNDTSTGFYGAAGGFKCTAPGASGPPTINYSVSVELGANADCIFVGKRLELVADGLDVHTLVGRRRANGVNVRTLAEAAPVEVSTSKMQLMSSLKVEKIKYVLAGVEREIGSFDIVSKFGGSAGSGGITGTQDVDLVIDDGGTIITNPDGGIELCINSNGTKQHGIVRIGGSSRQTSTELIIESGECS